MKFTYSLSEDFPPLAWVATCEGLDSRSVAALVPPVLAASATACSFGHGHCYDVRYGRRIARTLGASFSRLPIPDDFFHRYLSPVQMLCDGEVSIEALPIYRLIGMGPPGQTMLMGYLGDALSGGHLLGLEHASDPQGQLDAVWRKKYQGKGYSEQLLGTVLLPERYQAIRGSTRALMFAALDEAEAGTLDEKALLVELQHRQLRYISYFGRLLSSRCRGEKPFLDTDVLDTFHAMPLAHRQGQRAYRRMLVRHAPRLAAVPENKTHRPVTYADALRAGARRFRPVPNASRVLQWRLRRVQHLLGKMLVTASGGWFGPHNRNHYVHHDESIRGVEIPSGSGPRCSTALLRATGSTCRPWKNSSRSTCRCRQDHSIRINNVVAFLKWREAAGI